MKKIIVLFIGFVVFTSCTNLQNTTESLPPFSLEDVQKRSFLYFWELSDSENTLIPDRWPTPSFSSIAAQGFGYTAWLIGIEKGWISREEAAQRVARSFRFLLNLPQGPQKSGIGGYKGFYYHFLEMKNGHRFKAIELSSIDTGLLMAGILTCMTYFDHDTEVEAEIRRLADSLYRRVEWDWMFDPGQQALSMGWHPESGFIPAWWTGYNEAMIVNIMAMASPTHPIPAKAWESWCKPYLWEEFQGQEHVNFGPLFGHQYSHMYIDFRGIQDSFMLARGIDYFENSRRATLSNRAYCIANPLGFPNYSDSIWGLTACDGPGDSLLYFGGKEIRFMGYSARGAAADYHVDDGTLAPTAAGGSIPFAPEVCIPALRAMYNTYGPLLYDKYGFKDAFNLTWKFGHQNKNGWFDVDYIGIDQGPFVIQIANYENGFVWDLLKRNPYIVEGLKKAGFKGGWLEAQY